eukprot:TRINITY_DN8052_c0_g1_i2.p1 TRINITY_DN8052_c0_g1~~TRINITY_DN8052_c0_g1_i2.p1  ORF type:complete len:427 (+),score=73.91 TRINITY_DN8052_c0_g1_i2:47-1327(+)
MDISEFDKRTKTIYRNLCSFNYDKVKDLLDAERNKTNPPSWNVYVNLFLQLNIAEKQYSSLNFLLPKGFLRKENSLKVIYEVLFADFSKALEPISPPKNPFEEWLHPLFEQTIKFVLARSALVDIYGKLIFYSQSDEPSSLLSVHVPELRSILKSLPKRSDASGDIIEESMVSEIICLLNIFEALKSSSRWDFYNSVVQLDVANGNLKQWSYNYNKYKEERKVSFTNAFLLRPQQDPVLYQWFWKLKAIVLSKVSLYFHDVLSSQTPSPEFKEQCSKLSIDYASRISSFQKKTDATSINLIFDATIDGYRGPGYRLPLKHPRDLSGVELYPSVYSTPGPPPLSHWPNIIMILLDFADTLSNNSEIVHFNDIQSTYYITRVEERMILVAIYGPKKTDKNLTVTNFLSELSSQLKCKNIFSMLKAGSK